MADAVDAELTRRFAAGDQTLEPDLVNELKSIMRLHQLSAEDLFYKWESYCIKMDLESAQISLGSARALKQDVQEALEKSTRVSNIKNEKRTMATPRANVKNGDVFGMLDSLVPSTPGTGKLKSASRKRAHESPSMARVKTQIPSSSPDYKTPLRMEDQLKSVGGLQPTSFNDRTNPGEVIEILNEQLPSAEPPIAPFAESRIKLTAASDQKKLAYKPLAMKISEASEILDDRIDDFLKHVQDFHKLDDSVFGSAASQSTSEVIAVGRIACDSSEGKLNAASLVLECSRRMGSGLRIPINMDKLRGYSVFPGQIVALRGTNASGNEFVVDEMLQIPLLHNAASSPAALQAHKERLRGDADAMESDADPQPLSILFGSGPYTADDNLDFEPLHALCGRAADLYADALVLTGPFLDVDHPLIATGDFDLPEDAVFDPDTATMTTVFKYLVAPAINRLAASNPNITILLVPSIRDVLDKHVSWPQDAFPRKELGLPKAARIVTNPMTLSINEMVVGVSSQDVLFGLRQEELVSGRVADPSMLSRLPRYLLEQRHYFPLFPPPDRSKLPKTGTEEGVPVGASLDVSYLKLGEMVNVRPDVLLIPSSLPPFAKVIESVLVINPGYVSKRRAAGTYAKMTLYPPAIDENDMTASVLSHKVFERARVEITRI